MDEMEPLNPVAQGDVVLDYEQAIVSTMDRKRPCGSGRLAQIIIIFVAIMATNASNFIILGLPFMKSEPQHFTCKDRDTGEWHACTKHKICEEGLSKEEYEPDREDYNYIDNWQS